MPHPIESDEPAAPASSTPTTSLDRWYSRAAGAALAGSALAGAPQAASAAVIAWTPQNDSSLPATTVGVTSVVEPGSGSSIPTNQPVIWFDMLSGSVEIGAAFPTVNPDPFTQQFGIARFGDIAGAVVHGSSGAERQFMAELGHLSFTYVWPRRLDAGDVIGNDPANFLDGHDGNIHTLAQANYEATVGLWRFGSNPPPVDGYLGLRFSDDGGTNYNYGWAHITISSDYNVTLKEFAYEAQANTPIAAGAVPEPSSAALLVLGAAGFTTYRARRKGAGGKA